MPVSDTFVIAGGGLAGAKDAEALRGQGFGGRIVLAAEEDIRPYERPACAENPSVQVRGLARAALGSGLRGSARRGNSHSDAVVAA